MKSYSEWKAMSETLSLHNKAYINGEFQPAVSGDTFPCINPATEKLLADVASCDEADVNIAVAHAREVFRSGVWSEIHPRERKKTMQKWADLIEQHQDEFALLDTLDMGKSISEMV
ncbi:aldehyde dehydrogenase family protein, partial [Amphritea sp.]|uniref:aldehyde dehydrogenase family protein n=1 Tax=Amphritea sp. TaxID=1872502 RepID=UPI0025C24583